MLIEKYLMPTTVDECIKNLNEYKGSAQIMAGGTDLTLDLMHERVNPTVLVDITNIEGLDIIKVEDGKLIIGATATHADVGSNPEVKKYFPSLADGCISVGSPQIRNLGTIGGNIVSAQPAADAVIVLTALDAKCEIVNEEGTKIVPLEGLNLGVSKSKVDRTREIITKIIVDIPESKYGTAFTRFSQREALSLPMVNVAVKLEIEDSKISSARVVIGPVDIVPFRPKEVEELLIGMNIDDCEGIEKVAILASKVANPRDSVFRGSGAYRKVLVKDLVKKALEAALKDIKE